MEALHLPDNIKIHYAGSEVQTYFLPIRELGVSYCLYTAYPFVERMVFESGNSPIIPAKGMTKPEIEIPQSCATMKHCIQDSGLFTLMFGAMKGKHSAETIDRWYHALIEFTLNHNNGATCVEVDCQKVLGVEKAWYYRQRMKEDLPNNRIINVFHLEDGMKGLDRLIEFSEYIAISVPELRHAGKTEYVYTLASYIKNKKPEIDIHLLGCTGLKLLKQCSFCTSSDSTTYIAGHKYGFIEQRHVSRLRSDKIKDLVGEETYNIVRNYQNENRTDSLIMSIELLKRKYQKVAGNQDYYYAKEHL